MGTIIIIVLLIPYIRIGVFIWKEDRYWVKELKERELTFEKRRNNIKP